MFKKKKYIRLPKNIDSEIFFKKYFQKHDLLKYFQNETAEFRPNLKDLFFLHQYIILNKRLTILEIGTGWSSLVIQHALNLNKKKFLLKVLKIRKKNLFEMFVIDNNRFYLNIAKKRSELVFGKSKKKNFIFSEAEMVSFNGRFASQFKTLPLCNPDFIYLDGPSPLSVKKKINGFTTNHPDLMPMSCDILKFENFLCPGTIILIDGRTSNARFLKNNFQRNWKYFYNSKNDHNLFYLDEAPLGEYNKNLLNFYSEE